MLTAVCISLHRTTELGVLQVAASQYLAALIIGFVNSATVQPVIAIERTVFHREKAAGTHLLLSYAVSTFFRIQNVCPLTITECTMHAQLVLSLVFLAGMYASFPYALAQGDVELPYIVVQTVIWSLITYFMMGFELQAGQKHLRAVTSSLCIKLCDICYHASMPATALAR